jgi:hypothetical protein
MFDYGYHHLRRILVRVMNRVVGNDGRDLVVVGAAGIQIAIEAGEVAA